MRDPVNNFEIPEEWFSRAKISSEIIEGIKKGKMVLLSDGKVLRRGYTTGTTAAAAAKGAVLSLKKKIEIVDVPTPIGIRAILPVKAAHGRAITVKDSGDHGFDVTNGIEIIAEATAALETKIIFGAGIGIFTRGPKKGTPAITSAPMRQIRKAVEEALEETGLRGAEITLTIPRGADVAKETLNEKMGIINGISILGTTGFVEPWNEHLTQDKMELIRSAEKVVLTTGRIGMRMSHMLYPGYTIVIVGKNLDLGLKTAKGETIICGLPGIILKWAAPDILEKTGYATIQELVSQNPGHPEIDRALSRAKRKARNPRIILLNRDGTILREK